MKTRTRWYANQQRLIEATDEMEVGDLWAVRQIIATLYGGFIVVFEQER